MEEDVAKKILEVLIEGKGTKGERTPTFDLSGLNLPRLAEVLKKGIGPGPKLERGSRPTLRGIAESTERSIRRDQVSAVVKVAKMLANGESGAFKTKLHNVLVLPTSTTKETIGGSITNINIKSDRGNLTLQLTPLQRRPDFSGAVREMKKPRG